MTYKMAKKICMVAHQYYFRDPRVKRYAEALAEDGVQVDIICPRDPNEQEKKYHSNIRIKPIPIRRAYKEKANYISEYVLAFFFYFFKLTILFFRNRYQIIHVHSIPDFLIFTAFFPKIFGAKLILDIKDLMPETYMSKYKSKGKSFFLTLIKLQERLSVKFAHTVITANTNFKNNLLKRGATSSEITVINNIADTNIFNRSKYQRHNNNTNFTLIYPGTIAPRYGLEVAIRSLPSLVKKIPNIKLVIIGPEVDHTWELKKITEQLNLSEYVRFIPTLPLEQIPEHMIQADVGIYTAIPDSQTEIATPTKVIEYAIMGIPIISSRLKIVEEMFDDTSIKFFTPGDSDEFAQCVLDLYLNPSERQKLVKNADQFFVKNNSWTDEKNKYFKVIEVLLNK
jgi:glycosyltransferase involved in cell wall biosynthesis